MDPRALKVAFVTEDRAALRHCSRLTSAFGYEVHSIGSRQAAEQWIAAVRPDIVLIDASGAFEAALELCRSLPTDRAQEPCYKALFVHRPTTAQLSEAVESGVDDFLAWPVERGELLARLRTAARVLEYERRLNRGPRPAGSLTQRDWNSQLESDLADARRAVECIAIELDHPQDLQRLHGPAVLARIVARIGRSIASAADPQPVYAQLAAERYGVIWHGDSRQAAAWADQLRGQIAEEFLADESAPPVTLRCGISHRGHAAATAGLLLEQCQKALDHARQSGGDIAVVFDEFADEDQAWADFAAHGTLFDGTVARDIMVPCTVCLQTTDDLPTARALFRQTQLRALPVVDEEGKLAGLLTGSSLQQRASARDAKNLIVGRLMKSDVVSFDEQTTLTALIDYFMQESPLVIVIVHKGRPTGLVTPSSLATLSEQLTTQTFAPSTEADGNAAFVVPNLCGVDDV